jgi:hypothetical protein
MTTSEPGAMGTEGLTQPPNPSVEGQPSSTSGERVVGAAPVARSTTPRPTRSGRRTKVRPVFVVTLARSGSTLLRYLLDSHPDIVSPPELNLSGLLQHTAGMWTSVDLALGNLPVEGDPMAEMSPDVRRKARKVIDDVMATFAEAEGASVFCDKSLTTVDHLPTVLQCYPKAHFIFLYRYPLDMIASGIEASRWGFNAYGFAPYVGSAPGNFVAGLANYWIDRTTKMVEFERTCTAPHARIYYELLCDDPQGTLAQLCDFLGLTMDDELVARTFTREHGRGPGDYKIDFTGGISPGSVGHGSTLPTMLAPPQVAQIDALCAELDYPTLEAAWRGNLGALIGLKTPSTTDADAASEMLGHQVLALLTERTAAMQRAETGACMPMEIVVRVRDAYALTIGIDAAGGTTSEQSTPSVAPPSTRPRVEAEGDVLMEVAAGTLNLAQAALDGRVRISVAAAGDGPPHPTVREVMVALDALLRPADAG